MSSESGRQDHNVTLLVLGIGVAAFALQQTMIAPALEDLKRVFGASTSDVTWLVTAYLVAAAVATPIFGRLGDMFGKQRLLVVSLAVFTLGSVVGALAGSLGLLIVGRALQGLGAGVFPTSFGIIRDEFQDEKVPAGIALVGAIVAIGASIGFPLGGFLVDHADYSWIFWTAVVIGAVATLTAYRFVPESPIRTPGRVDFGGAVLLGGGLTSLLIGITQSGDWGWSSARTLGLIAAGLAILAGFIAFERRHPDPMIDIATLSRRPVLATDLATLLVGVGLFGTFILVPQLAVLPTGGEVGLGLTATEAGLLLLPAGLTALLVAPFVGRIGERVGWKLPLLAGSLVAGGALVGLAADHGSVGAVILWISAWGIGLGAAFAAMPNLIVEAVDQDETGEATGVNMIMQRIGAALGVQIAGSIVAQYVLETGLPADAGFTSAFIVGAVCSAVAALFVLLIPGRPRTTGLERSPR